MGYDVSMERINNTTTAPENPIFKKYNTLNALGKTKADEYITDLAENSKYTSDNTCSISADIVNTLKKAAAIQTNTSTK